jgi:putative tryptophan/tyrosine transport system substrate-binding protein
LQLLKEMFPGLSRVAILFNPTNHYTPLALQSARKGAQVLHLSLAVYEVHDITTLNAAFVQLTKNRPDGLLVPGDPFLVSQRSRIAQFAIENKLPSVYTFREHVEAGGLIAYTPNYDDLFRRAANYVDKDPKRHEAGRDSDRAVDEVSSIDQPQDREDARLHPAAMAACPRR